MSNPIDVSDVIIEDKEITLRNFSNTKKLNIYNLVKSFDIFESLDNQTLQADFYLADGIELVNYFPLAGEEYIEVSFQTPRRKLLTYQFFVESVIGQKSNLQSNVKTYSLRCVTKDFLKNSYTVYSKRYKDMDYSEAVKSVLKYDLNTTKNFEVEATDGKFDYVVNEVRPFQVISLLSERAVSSKNKSSLFYFYEDSQGYHFTTIEKLIEDRKDGAEDRQFFFDTSNRSSPYEKVLNYRNILSYETIVQGSSIDKVKTGAMRNQVREFDIMTGDYYTKYEYVNLSDSQNFKNTDSSKNEDMNTSAFNAEVTKLPSITKMVVKDSLRPDMKHNESIVYKRAYANKISQYGLRLKIYGDTSLHVGDVIKLVIPEISGLTVDPPQQKVYSENYIIVQLKHRLDQKDNNLFEHYMVLDIRKPNMYTAIG